ncbi:MAG: hypothetical protein Q9219_006192 [cf. Caloplaca sp. 3 TL-2023]
MPVTFTVASHGAKVVSSRGFKSLQNYSPQTSLKELSHVQYRDCQEIFMSSFSDPELQETCLQISENGFVHTAIQSYNHHQNLVLKPDDVWLAILTQFNIYVNAHSEELRKYFVDFEGKRSLKVVYGSGTAKTLDWPDFIGKIDALIERNIVDPTLRSWIVPDFSTTTDQDKVVCQIVMMSTLQKYFGYRCCMLCGIPSVTLLGEKVDWENMLHRIERLKEFGQDTSDWYQLLHPVLSRFVTSFDHPTSAETKDFWQRIAHHHSGGSGPSYYSGWITAFCFWDRDGKRLARRGRFSSKSPIEGVPFHSIEDTEVPPGWTSVPVEIDENGHEFMGRLVAGSVGIKASAGQAGQLNTLQPEAGWWMFSVKDENVPKPEQYGSKDVTYADLAFRRISG